MTVPAGAFLFVWLRSLRPGGARCLTGSAGCGSFGAAMPPSARDIESLRGISKELSEIARILARYGEQLEGRTGEGRDHTEALNRIQASLADIATVLRGLTGRQ